jgi:xanthine dehydrogenase accessory factor
VAWRAAGAAVVLGTITRTWGSAPRPVGSVVAVREDGQIAGSVSGGCIEDDLIERYRRADAITDGPPERVKYGIRAEEAHRFGLPCGGTLELVIEFNPDAALLAQLVQALGQGQLMARRLHLADGQVQLQSSQAPAALEDDGTWLVNTFGPSYRMLLIGAGQLAQYLATMARFSGFEVCVCDPREEYRQGWQMPDVPLISGMPDDVVREFRVDRRSCVIALTHDPKLDDLALLEALETEAFYVGAIGSRRNNDARRARLIEHFDQTVESLSRLRGPIGLYIGSKTPPEIAVSIMAEVLAVKNQVALPRDSDVATAKNALAPAAPDAPACPIRT